ncbi:MAG TPA: hypothetical protein VFA22_01315 [Stellaceae bacterium]|nr:hypothetical protein [Stellaceae bacterium]
MTDDHSFGRPAAANDIEAGCQALAALADLMACADPERWASLQRPNAAGLSALIRGPLCRIRTGLQELAA